LKPIKPKIQTQPTETQPAAAARRFEKAQAEVAARTKMNKRVAKSMKTPAGKA
jgi:hypothetical protein